MRAEETWHAFCYTQGNRRKSLNINHLGAPRARKALLFNALRLARKLNSSIPGLARLLNSPN